MLKRADKVVFYAIGLDSRQQAVYGRRADILAGRQRAYSPRHAARPTFAMRCR